MSPDLAEWRRTQGSGKDFLAVFDVRPGESFGKLIAMLPAGEAAMAHHANYVEPANVLLYANDWIANRTYRPAASRCTERAHLPGGRPSPAV